MTTDRAKRYAANRTITDDKSDGCLFCGSKRNLTVDHLSGDENDGHPSNLAWLCKSCNTRKGAAFAKAGIGRLTNQYNPCQLSPEERKNFSQLGFDFPPRREYDEARAVDRKRKQQAHAEELRARREAKAAHSRRLKADRKAEQARLKAGISSLGLELQRARKAGDKDAIRSLTDEINDMAGDIRRNPASITSPRQWADAVAASLGAPSSMSTRSAATRIRATVPGTRRKFAASMRVNPGKIPTYAQYAFAVAGYNHGKGDPALGETIHRTPKATRASYARMIAATKRERGTDSRTGSTVPF
jgi:hypothetical protein